MLKKLIIVLFLGFTAGAFAEAPETCPDISKTAHEGWDVRIYCKSIPKWNFATASEWNYEKAKSSIPGQSVEPWKTGIVTCYYGDGECRALATKMVNQATFAPFWTPNPGPRSLICRESSDKCNFFEGSSQ